MPLKHDHACRGRKSPVYIAWLKMHNRVHNPHYCRFHRYGGRNITICDRWHRSNPYGFLNFLDDMPPHPGPGHSLHRINNDGNYEPSNCCWASVQEQAANSFHPVGITGLRGVWLAPQGRYRASITHEGKRHHLGTFNSLQAASKAYEQAKAALAKAA
jgi:hypothetical protein